MATPLPYLLAVPQFTTNTVGDKWARKIGSTLKQRRSDGHCLAQTSYLSSSKDTATQRKGFVAARLHRTHKYIMSNSAGLGAQMYLSDDIYVMMCDTEKRTTAS